MTSINKETVAILHSILEPKEVTKLIEFYTRAAMGNDTGSDTITAMALLIAGKQQASVATAMTTVASLTDNPAQNGLIYLAHAIHFFTQANPTSPAIHALVKEAIDAASLLLEQAIDATRSMDKQTPGGLI